MMYKFYGLYILNGRDHPALCFYKNKESFKALIEKKYSLMSSPMVFTDVAFIANQKIDLPKNIFNFYILESSKLNGNYSNGIECITSKDRNNFFDHRLKYTLYYFIDKEEELLFKLTEINYKRITVEELYFDEMGT